MVIETEQPLSEEALKEKKRVEREERMDARDRDIRYRRSRVSAGDSRRGAQRASMGSGSMKNISG